MMTNACAVCSVYQQFHAKSFVSSLLGFSDIWGFFREVQEAQKDSNVCIYIASSHSLTPVPVLPLLLIIIRL